LAKKKKKGGKKKKVEIDEEAQPVRKMKPKKISKNLTIEVNRLLNSSKLTEEKTQQLLQTIKSQLTL
jgi:hypothetical protein